MRLRDAKRLKSGQHIHHKTLKNSDGTPMRFRVTSVKLWKTRPKEVLIGLKRGMYEYLYITENDIKDYMEGYE